MKFLPSFLIALILVATVAGCSESPASRTFTRAEELINTDSAEQALQLLDSIDTLTLTTEAERARYSLLLTHARYKNYIDDSSLTILEPAIDYFINQDHGSRKEQALTLFMASRIHSTRGELAVAITEVLRAEGLAERLSDDKSNYLLLGFIRQAVLDCYSAVYNWSGQDEYARKALDAFKLSGDSSYIAYALVDYGHGRQNVSKNEEAVLLCDSALVYAYSHHDNRLISFAELIKARSLKILGRDEDALKSYLTVLKINPNDISDIEKPFILNRNNGSKVSLDDSVKIDAGLMEILNRKEYDSGAHLASIGKYKEAYDYSLKQLNVIARRLKISSKQTVTLAASSFIDNQLAIEKKTRK